MPPVYLLAIGLEPVRPAEVRLEHLPHHWSPEAEEVVVEVCKRAEKAVAYRGQHGHYAGMVSGVDVAVRQNHLGLRVRGD